MKIRQNKIQRAILHESNSAIFDIGVIPNVEANYGVVVIRTLEANVIHLTIVFR